MTEHTATPWYAQHRHIYKHDWMPGTDHAIADADKGPTEAEALANAAFIVRACNAYDELLATCKAARRFAAADSICTCTEILEALDAVIAKAEEK